MSTHQTAITTPKSREEMLTNTVNVDIFALEELGNDAEPESTPKTSVGVPKEANVPMPTLKLTVRR